MTHEREMTARALALKFAVSVTCTAKRYGRRGMGENDSVTKYKGMCHQEYHFKRITKGEVGGRHVDLRRYQWQKRKTISAFSAGR